MPAQSSAQVHRTLLKVSQVTRDPSFQVRHRMDHATVRRYAELMRTGTFFPPISVAHADGVFILTDGWHRLAASEELGRETIEAEVSQVTRADALWMAAEANLKHGLPLKTSELRNVFRAFIRAKKNVKRHGNLMSYREMEKILGKPHTTLRNWMIKDFPRFAEKMGGTDEFVGQGGLQDIEVPSVDPATQLLLALQGEFTSSADPTFRGSIIAMVKEALADMEASANWLPQQASDF